MKQKKIKYSLISLLILATCAHAGNDLTLLPTRTNGYERNFNPFHNAVGSFFAQDFIYEPLWIFNVWHPEHDYPRLAESVEISSDYRSVTYHLRQGVKWSDGEDFNADDVVFTVDYARQHPEYAINIDLYDSETNSGLVNSVTKIDDYTVRFNLLLPNSLAHQSIGALYPLPEHIFSLIDNPAEFSNVSAVGTGPFTEVSQFHITHIKLCRNPYYYEADRLKIDCLRFPHYASNDHLWAAARRGKIDWMGQGIHDPKKQYTDFEPSNKVWLAPGANTNVQINTRRPPLDNVSFRQALSMALDRDEMLVKDTFGLTSPTPWPVGTGPGYSSWYVSRALQPYQYLMEYNPERAKKLLDQAGFVDADGDGWRDGLKGQSIDIGIAVPGSWTDWFNVVLTMVENFKAIGVNAHVEGMDAQKWFERMPTGDFDMYMMWTNPGITPWKIYSELFDPNGMVVGKLSSQAMNQFRSGKMERLLQEFTETGDLAKQQSLMTEMQVIVAENMPILSLFANPIWYEYNDGQYTGWVTEDNPYVRPQVHMGVPERLIHLLNLRPVKK